MQGGKLQDILKEGTPIQTRFQENEEWMTNTLFTVSESAIEINIIQDNTDEENKEESFLDDYLSIGDSIECRYPCKGNDYLIEGWISKIKSDPPQRITVQVHKINIVEKSDKLVEHNVFLGCVLKDGPKEKGMLTIAKKISRNHAVLVSKVPLEEIKEKMYIELLVTGSITFKTSVEVSPAKGMEQENRYLVRFVDTDVLNNRILENFFKEFEQEQVKNSNDQQNSFWKRNSKINIE